MGPKEHWEKIYSTKAADAVSWYQEHASLSLNLIRAAGVSANGAIIDVGGGASTLVDDLLNDGFGNVTVLDLSGAALEAARRRLGTRAPRVHWLEANITKVTLAPHAYDVWHDRAVFHFLTTPEDRSAYVRSVLHAVKPGGHVIVATFAEDGPTQCSGLPVMRYSADALHSEFGEPFRLLRHEKEAHHTPNGTVQQFIYCFWRKLRSQLDFKTASKPTEADRSRSGCADLSAVVQEADDHRGEHGDLRKDHLQRGKDAEESNARRTEQGSYVDDTRLLQRRHAFAG